MICCGFFYCRCFVVVLFLYLLATLACRRILCFYCCKVYYGCVRAPMWENMCVCIWRLVLQKGQLWCSLFLETLLSFRFLSDLVPTIAHYILLVFCFLPHAVDFIHTKHYTHTRSLLLRASLPSWDISPPTLALHPSCNPNVLRHPPNACSCNLIALPRDRVFFPSPPSHPPPTVCAKQTPESQRNHNSWRENAVFLSAVVKTVDYTQWCWRLESDWLGGLLKQPQLYF